MRAAKRTTPTIPSWNQTSSQALWACNCRTPRRTTRSLNGSTQGTHGLREPPAEPRSFGGGTDDGLPDVEAAGEVVALPEQSEQLLAEERDRGGSDDDHAEERQIHGCASRRRACVADEQRCGEHEHHDDGRDDHGARPGEEEHGGSEHEPDDGGRPPDGSCCPLQAEQDQPEQRDDGEQVRVAEDALDPCRRRRAGCGTRTRGAADRRRSPPRAAGPCPGRRATPRARRGARARSTHFTAFANSRTTPAQSKTRARNTPTMVQSSIPVRVNRLAPGYADQATERMANPMYAGSAFGTRRRSKAGRRSTSSARQAAAVRMLRAVKPHRPSR